MRIQEREGWLSEPALRDLAERLGVPLHRLESVSTFYTHFRRTPPRGAELAVCRDVACSLAGGALARARLCHALTGRDDVEVREVSCLGRCEYAPAALVNGVPVGRLSPEELAHRARNADPRQRGVSRPQRAAIGWRVL